MELKRAIRWREEYMFRTSTKMSLVWLGRRAAVVKVWALHRV